MHHNILPKATHNRVHIANVIPYYIVEFLREHTIVYLMNAQYRAYP